MINEPLLESKSKLLQPENWLILSHAFNMDGRAASQTITDKIPYLIDAGVNLHVLSAITGIKDNRFFHQQLIAWGPSAFRFDFRHWLSNKIGKGLIYKFLTTIVSIILLPLMLFERIIWGYSSQWSWAFPAFFKGFKLIKKNNIKVIYSTGGAWSAHLAALWLKSKTNLIWIAEIHDPLVARKYINNQELIVIKNSEARKKYWLEKKICQKANLVWWFTESAMNYANRRNVNLNTKNNAKGMAIIPGASKPIDIREKIRVDEKKEISEYLNIGHFGSLAIDRSLEPVLDILPKFFKNNPEAINKIKFHIYGGELDKNSKKIIGKMIIKPRIINHGRLEYDLINNITGRQRVYELMKKTDVLLLLHGNSEWCEEYIPSKIYDYFWTDRPIWGIIKNNILLKQLLQERKNYVSNANDPESIYRQLDFFWKNWNNKNIINSTYNPISPQIAVQVIMREIENLRSQYE